MAKIATGIDDRIERTGIMLVLSSPSGAGKSTIARYLQTNVDNLEVSVSMTTRQRRGSEIDGTHYHFVSAREFERDRESDALLEWAEVHGNFYATPREEVEQALSEGRDVLFDIDWQGAAQIREAARDDLVSVFILPPDAPSLRERLERRAEDDGATIKRRLANARTEIQHWDEYDHVIVNHDLEESVKEVLAILHAARTSAKRQTGLAAGVAKISADLKAME